MRSFVCILLAFFLSLQLAQGLKLDIAASPGAPPPRCVREFVSKEQLVVVSVNSNGHVGDGQILSMRIVDTLGNEYRKTRDFAGQIKIAFTTLANAPIDICFENELVRGGSRGYLSREIEVDVESGAAARDWNAIRAAEDLKPTEVIFRKVEVMIDELYEELQYLIRREERLRDTNESTNRRVRNFSVFIIIGLIGVGIWEIQYLRSYFRSKHIL